MLDLPVFLPVIVLGGNDVVTVHRVARRLTDVFLPRALGSHAAKQLTMEGVRRFTSEGYLCIYEWPLPVPPVLPGVYLKIWFEDPLAHLMDEAWESVNALVGFVTTDASDEGLTYYLQRMRDIAAQYRTAM